MSNFLTKSPASVQDTSTQRALCFSARAECRDDLMQVIINLDKVKAGLVRVKSEDNYLEPNIRSGEVDIEFHFYSPFDYSQFLEVISNVTDAHVMRQTLKPVPMADNDMQRDFDR